MKTYQTNRFRTFTGIAVFMLMAAFAMVSCTKDDPEITPPDNVSIGTTDRFLFFGGASDKSFQTLYAGGGLGDGVFTGSGWESWRYAAATEAGGHQYVVAHNEANVDGKEFMIRVLAPDGAVGYVTESGSWTHNYETFLGFRVGNRGFIFGQDSYGSHNWFVQEVTVQGTLGEETDTGTWNNYYGSATPMYVNGNTYIFFQTNSNDNYWFISRVSTEGKLSDVCDGYWGYFWKLVTSVEISGATYLVGYHEAGTIFEQNEWFVQRINSDGTMGEETSRGTWPGNLAILSGYTSGGKAYVILMDDNGFGKWFINEVGASGIMGSTVASGQFNKDYEYIIPFSKKEPGGLRYLVGWDLSATTGSPTRSWSSLFKDPWTAPTRSGGGAALAQIDGDAGGRYDAVLMGIQDLAGPDRYYYKVAYNLDGAGKAASWSTVIYGPYLGQGQGGGGADIADIDGNGVPDLLLMNVDDPEGANSFRYNIGWNLGANGRAASWSEIVQVNGPGWFDSGGGAALGDIDKNGRPDVVFMAVDNADPNDSYWYMIGRNLDQNGIAASWSPCTIAPAALGYHSAGGGAALADINGNGKPDLVLTSLDSPTGPNIFWCYIGWDIDINGQVQSWTSKMIGPSPGNMTCGGGTAIADIDKNGILDLLLMSIDDPNGID